MKDTAPMTRGADESAKSGATAGFIESLRELVEPYDGGLDLYDIDAEY